MISTKDIPTGGSGKAPKTLQPGNANIKINSIYLDKVPWNAEAYNVMMDCEGEGLGESFEGFFIDKNNESLGRHAGQVGRIRAGQWAFESKTLQSGVDINRDVEISKFLRNIAVATGCLEWLEAQDNKHETIESLVEAMNEDAPFEGKFISACLGGREYENKGGYTNYDLFLPKYTKTTVPFADAEGDTSKVAKFNDSNIIKKKVKEVESFEAGGGAGKKPFGL